MDNTVVMDRLERTSRISTLLMALGALVVLGALWLSYGQLRTLQAEVRSLESDATQLRTQNRELSQRAEAMRNEIKGLREALAASRDAIVAFHQRDYGTAVALYDQALRADPSNAYLLNLKAYSLFKLKRFGDAIDVQKESIRIDPGYSWGFFDLARFQCAAGDLDGARKSIEIALDKRPGLRSTMERDGEFQRLCARVLK
ncbi:MAG: tetratricopeptide repeat protein [Pseudomonadota bacterium]